MFKTSLTIISKPKPKCSQLVELHNVDDYLGPRFSSVFLLFSTLWPCGEALLAKHSENITVKFENARCLFRIRSRLWESASLWSGCQENSTLLYVVQLSVMTGGALNIYSHIYITELLHRFLWDKYCLTDYSDRHLKI